MTQQKLTLQATKRTLVGRKVKQIRKEGKVPAHIFGKGVEGVNLTLVEKEFRAVYSKAGETGLVDVQIEGEAARPALIVEVMRHPINNAILHVDLHQVNMNEAVTAHIPVEVTGDSEAVKNGAVLVVTYNEIEVEALPANLPEHFTIDLSALTAVGDTITVASLDFDREKVKLSITDEEVLATVQAPKEEVVEELVAEVAEVELTKQGATKEEVVEGENAPKAEKTEKPEEKKPEAKK